MTSCGASLISMKDGQEEGGIVLSQVATQRHTLAQQCGGDGRTTPPGIQSPANGDVRWISRPS